MKTLEFRGKSTQSDYFFSRSYGNEFWSVRIVYCKTNAEYQEEFEGDQNFDPRLITIQFVAKGFDGIRVDFIVPGYFTPRLAINMSLDTRFRLEAEKIEKLRECLADASDAVDDVLEVLDTYFPGAMSKDVEYTKVSDEELEKLFKLI